MPAIETPFPHAERRDLAEPPIELILAQIRFPTLAELYSNEGYVKFATAIRAEYAKATPLHEVGLEIVQGRPKEIAATPVWKFEDIQGLWTLTLTPDFLALEVRRYQRFSEFRARFASVWQRLVELHGIGNRTRLGLRYIDRFATDKPHKVQLPDNWFDHLRPEVFPLRRLDPALTQAGQLAQSFDIRNDLALTYRSAFKWGSSDDPEYRECVLDLDCYDPSVAGVGDVSSRLDDLKEVTHNAFWWTFESLLVKMEPGLESP